MQTLQVVDAGVFILRSFLNTSEQQQCLSQCQTLYENDKAMYKKHGSISNILKKIKAPHRGRYLLAFEPDKKSITSYFNDLAQSAFDALHSQILNHKQSNLIMKTLPRPLPISHEEDQSINTNDQNAEEINQNIDDSDDTKVEEENDEIESEAQNVNQDDNDKDTLDEIADNHHNQWISDRLNCVLYPLGSMLGRHVDNMDGWVILFSLGCDARFYLQLLANERRKNGIVLSMKSGDVIIFEGGDEQRVLHGVDAIVPDTTPEHFKDVLPNGRIGLQLRQYIGVETHKAQ